MSKQFAEDTRRWMLYTRRALLMLRTPRTMQFLLAQWKENQEVPNRIDVGTWGQRTLCRNPRWVQTVRNFWRSWKTKMVVFLGQTIRYSDLIPLGVRLGNVWKPSSMRRREMSASYNIASEVLVKSHDKKGWDCRTLDDDMEPQDGNPCHHSAPRSSKHLLIWGHSKWCFQGN